MLGSGGMSSSHSATVIALAVAISLQEGIGASAFVVSLVLAFVVMYDATRVRLHDGRQAEVTVFYVIGVYCFLHMDCDLLSRLLGNLPMFG
ncbi:Acid phosphatase/vanadium-dependent haloperoxidase-related protein [Corchorus capsularis]|uniref:Acid phosphatase/vanadium-dependent haloperoxidase-related protein n=1 Tax=Corchorus capsularis TaxID=210143 RepID=A0A1R3IX37_COCAP|nr:Acid phosphatase/vanadium-dependent haloperoxidase-related protein [Corchorus capsularis]